MVRRKRNKVREVAPPTTNAVTDEHVSENNLQDKESQDEVKTTVNSDTALSMPNTLPLEEKVVETRVNATENAPSSTVLEGSSDQTVDIPLEQSPSPPNECLTLIDRLNEELEAIKKENDMLRRQNSEHESQLTTQNEIVESQRREIEVKASFEDRFTQVESERVLLLERLEASEQKSASLDTVAGECKKHEENVAQKCVELASALAKCDVLSEELAYKERINIETQMSIYTMTTQLQQFEKMKVEASELHIQLASCLSDLDATQKTLTSVQDLKSQLETKLKVTENGLSMTLAKNKEDIEHLNEEKHGLLMEIEHLKGEELSLRSSCDSEIRHLQAELVSVKEQAERKVQTAREETEKVRNDSEEFEKNMLCTEKEKVSLEKELADMKKIIEDMQVDVDKLELKEKEVVDLSEVVDTLKREMDMLRKQSNEATKLLHEQLDSTNNELARERQNTQTLFIKYKDDMSLEMERAHSEWEHTHHTEVERVRDEEKLRGEQNLKLKTEELSAELEIALGNSQRVVGELTKSKEALEKERKDRLDTLEKLERAEEEKCNLQVRIREIETDLQIQKELAVKASETSLLEEKLSNNEHRIAALQSELLASQNALAAFQAEQTENHHTIKILQEELYTASVQLASMKEETQKAVYEIEAKAEQDLSKLRSELSASEQRLRDSEIKRDDVMKGMQVDKERAHVLEQELANANARVADLAVQAELTLSLRLSEETSSQLRDDCVQLEKQLRTAHETIANLKSELLETQRRLQSRDNAAMEARNECASLRAELEHAQFEGEQLRRAAIDRDAAARVMEVEREISEQKTLMTERIETLMEELRVCESRLEQSEATNEEVTRQLDSLREQASDWRSRCDLAVQEAEALQRGIGEVRHLESALEQSHNEHFSLATQLKEAREAALKASTDKDALAVQLTIVQQQLEERTERLMRAEEGKKLQTLRMVEMESQLANRRTSIDRRGDNGVAETPATLTVTHLDESQPNVQDSPTEMRAKLEAAEKRIKQLESRDPMTFIFGDAPTDEEAALSSNSTDNLVDDYGHGSTTHLLLASSPLPSVMSRVRRIMRSWRARGGRQRALMPYVRYGLLAYFIFSQIALIHCWVFAACL